MHPGAPTAGRADARTAADLLRPHYIALDPELSLGEAEGLLSAARARCLPVVEGDRLTGLLRHRALQERYADALRPLRAAPAAERRERVAALRARPVREAMDPPGESATSATPLPELARLLDALETGFVGVHTAMRDGARLLGIVTESDLLRAGFDRSFRRRLPARAGRSGGGAPQDPGGD